MNILLGLGVIAFALGFTGMMVSVLTDRDWLFIPSIAAVGLPIVGGILLLGVYLALGGSMSNPLIEGTCYRAVRHTTTTLMPVGKVLIPSTTSGIDLEVIRCP